MMKKQWIVFGLLSLSVMMLASAPTTADFVQCDGAPCMGTDLADLMNGTGGSEEIEGLAGNDIIFAGPGFDLIHGHQDDDVIFGGPDSDDLRGHEGNDILFPGPDTLDNEQDVYHDEGNDSTIVFAGDNVYCLIIRDNGGSDTVSLIGFGPYSATKPFGIPGFGVGWIMTTDPIAGGEIWIEISENDDLGIETIHGLTSPSVTFDEQITGQCD